MELRERLWSKLQYFPWTRSPKQVFWPDLVSNLKGRSLFMVAGQRMYMMHMLLLPFLPITALIIQVGFEFLRFINFCLFSPQNSITLSDLLMYQREVATIGSKVQGWYWLSILPQVFIITCFEPKSLISIVQVDGITLLEKFITNLQKERAEVAFHIFTNGSKTLEMNLTTRWQLRTSLNQKLQVPSDGQLVGADGVAGYPWDQIHRVHAGKV